LKLGTWDVRSLYGSGSLTAAARELAKYKLDSVGVQEVRWDKRGSARNGGYNFFYGKGNETPHSGTESFVHDRILSAVKIVEAISDGMSYIVMRGRWCNIVLNMHAPSEEKSDDSKDGFIEEFEQVFNNF